MCCCNRTGGSLQPLLTTGLSLFLPVRPGRHRRGCDLALFFTLRSPCVRCWSGKRLFPEVLHCGRGAGSAPAGRLRSAPGAGRARLLPARRARLLCQLLALPQASAGNWHRFCTFYTSHCLALHVCFSNSCCGGWRVYDFQTMITQHWELDQVASCCGRMNVPWLW